MNPDSTGASLLLMISAPSGAGKTTLCRGLLASDPQLARAITCTTRAPRSGEQDGVDYYFLDAETFAQRVEAGEFLEHALVHGHRYGTLKTEVLGRLRQGQDVLLNIDVQGAATLRTQAAQNPELKRALVTIFLTPPALAILEQRLRNRGQDAPAVIQERLRAARAEIAHWRHFDYLIISGTMEEDLRRAQAIITAERTRQLRVPPPVI